MDISSGIDSLVWGNISKSFDDTDLRLTRPGFGVIVLLKPDKAIQKLCKNFLLMKTRDTYLHITVFQVFLTFHRDYDPFSIPNNLLVILHDYINKSTKMDVEKINKSLETLHIDATENWLLFGRDYPSHLVIKVECRQVSNVLQQFKESVNRIGYEWLTEFAKELEKRKFKSNLVQTEIGSKLSSNGWDLYIGYTANPDYKTHVTLGILKTTDEKLNAAILEIHKNEGRIISANFLPEEGNGDNDNIMKSWGGIVESFRIQELKKLSETTVNEYPTLRVQVKNAKIGATVELSKSLIDEWGDFIMKSLSKQLKHDKQTQFKVLKIHMSIINMARMQNFEQIKD
ncbi:hypothetical protein HNY73_001050 [Argiope bruennichi]|uniref:Uncharacterized protein n=1 Tax=Argiope bruennichi TaxID=94029 RepID=A0A8T0G040_ARGBR|nr:hypothetical protein HNY73_001050 [Argiope bruennichi]